jgi:hypothetical protein
VGVQEWCEENDDLFKKPVKTSAKTIRIKLCMNAAGNLHDTGHL